MLEKVNSPHDRFFYAAFKNKETAVSFMEAYLPKPVADLMDLPALAVDNTRFVDKALQEHHSDLLYQVPLKNGETSYIYLLFEHQSTPDATMPFRLLRYILQVWEHLFKKHLTKRLLPVLPLVLSQSKWLYSPRLQDMLELDKESQAILSPWLPDFTHLLVDLSDMDAHSIKGNVFGKIVLHLLKSGREGLLPEVYTRLRPLLQALSRQDNAMELIEALLRYSAQVVEEVSMEELRDLVVSNLSETAGERLMTIAEQIEQEVAEKYQQQITEIAKEKEQALHEKEQALHEKEALLKQLREAGIEPKH